MTNLALSQRSEGLRLPINNAGHADLAGKCSTELRLSEAQTGESRLDQFRSASTFAFHLAQAAEFRPEDHRRPAGPRHADAPGQLRPKRCR